MDYYAEVRQKIDEEIAILEKRLLTLRAQRNRLAPIYRLPIETMVRIFHLAYDYSKTLLPIALSAVSRQWRDIALDLPELWDRIENELKLKHIPAYMARSRQRPLHISLYDLGEDTGDKLSLIVQELPRIKKMSMTGSGLGELLSYSERVWLTQAPILQELRLEHFVIPQVMFSGHVPRLRDLTLVHCKFHWNSLPVFPQLEVLTIRRPQIKIPVDEFLDRIHLMPNLRDISTDRALTGARNPIGQIYTLKLEVIMLAGEHSTHIAEMLRAMVLLEVEHLSLRFRQGNPGNEAVIIDTLNHCCAFSTTSIKTLSVTARHNFCGYAIEAEPVSAVLQFRYTSRTTTEAIHDICSRLNLEELQDLLLDLSDVAIGQNFWWSFKGLNLKELTVRNDVIKMLAEYLSEEHGIFDDLLASPSMDEDMEDLLAEVISFPCLDNVLIRRYRHTPEYLSNLDKIAQYMRIRKQCGKGIRNLVVSSKSPLPDQQNDALKEGVVEFEVVPYDVKTEFEDLFEA